MGQKVNDGLRNVLLLFFVSFNKSSYSTLWFQKTSLFLGSGQLRTVSILEGSVQIPCSAKTCPRHVLSCWKAYNFILFIWSLLNTRGVHLILVLMSILTTWQLEILGNCCIITREYVLIMVPNCVWNRSLVQKLLKVQTCTVVIHWLK